MKPIREIKLSDIFAYLQGNIREFLYNNIAFRWLLRAHIREQIDWRIKVMNKECYMNGSCVMCGCDTPALQMASKACEGHCYPKMMGRKAWKRFKAVREINVEAEVVQTSVAEEETEPEEEGIYSRNKHFKLTPNE